MSRKYINKRIQGSTLIEILVTMIIIGIVFLIVEEGLTIVNKICIKHINISQKNNLLRDSYSQLKTILSNVDSVVHSCHGTIEIYKEDNCLELILCDSVLINQSCSQQDTLLTNIYGIRYSEVEPNLLEIIFMDGDRFFSYIKLSPQVKYQNTMTEIEKGYGYQK